MDKRKSLIEDTMEEQANVQLAERSDETILQQSIQDGILRQHIYKNTLRIMCCHWYHASHVEVFSWMQLLLLL